MHNWVESKVCVAFICLLRMNVFALNIVTDITLNADVYVVFCRLLCQKKKKKNDIKRSNKHNHLREVNAKHLHSPTNSLNEPILDPRGSYTDEQHSFT